MNILKMYLILKLDNIISFVGYVTLAGILTTILFLIVALIAEETKSKTVELKMKKLWSSAKKLFIISLLSWILYTVIPTTKQVFIMKSGVETNILKYLERRN